MLKDYHVVFVPDGSTKEKEQRLLAVQAVLEVLKSHDAGAGSNSAYTLLQALTAEINAAATAIQKALEK